MNAQFLLLRSEDHVVLGVRFVDMHLVSGGSAPPSLRADGPGAFLVLTFPPQHVVEEVIGANPADSFELFDHLGCRLAGPSRIAFHVPAGTTVPLTVEGILAAVDAGQVLPGGPANPATPGDEAGPTAIELPWRIVMSPEPRAGNGFVTTSHSAGPLELETTSFGLWSTSLRASDATRAPRRRDRARTPATPPRDAGLALRPIDRRTADLLDPTSFPIALPRAFRDLIAEAGADAPAPMERLDLSSLGGSLSVRAKWSNRRWLHDATLGRDRYVYFAAAGVLYPLGHRAELIEVTERVCVESTPPIMALQIHRTLVVAESTRAPTPDDVELARGFPFGEVEILESAVSVAEPAVTFIEQAAPEAGELLERRADAEARLEDAIVAVLAVVIGPGTRPEDVDPMQLDFILDQDRVEPDGTPVPAAAELGRYHSILDEIAFIDKLIDGAGLESIPLFFTPTATDGSIYRFHVRLAGALGDVQIELPLLFVFDHVLSDPNGVIPDLNTLTDPRALAMLDQAYAASRAGQVETHGVAIDLVRSGTPAASDVQEVHRLNLVGTGHQGGFFPSVGPPLDVVSAAEKWAFEAAMPAVRALLGAAPPNTKMLFSDGYLRNGEAAANVVFGTLGSIGLDFTGRANRSGGLIAPQLKADAVSRAHGLVQSAALGAPTLDPAKVLGEASTLLGFKLSDLVKPTALHVPPNVTARLDGATPEVRMEWKDIVLRDAAPFVARNAKLTLSVVTRGTESTTTCTVTNFTLALPSAPRTLLEVAFDSLGFSQLSGQPPKLEVGTPKVSFKGLLRLVEELQKHIPLVDSAARIHVDDKGITAQYLLPVPSAACGVFVMRNIAFGAAVAVPFDGEPVSVAFAFASRANPFNLSVLMFGGGGYLELEVNHRGLQRLEASLEFGASVAIDFIVATGEVHAMGGVRFVLQAGQVQLTGFIRLGGSVEVLGLVSVSVELLVALSYDSGSNEMYGRATLIVEIDLLLYSDSVELDTGKWELVGGSAPRTVEDFLGFPVRAGELPPTRPTPFGARLLADETPERPADTWRRYRLCFASDGDHR